MAAGEGMETTDRGSKPLACTHCNARFSRPSHLNRHRLTHLPSSRKSLIKCPHCDRTFSRNDVLLRHLRGAHHVDLVVKRSVQRSCHRCVSKKLKCDRLQPCQSCTGAQAICEFPGASQSRSPDLESETLDALDGNENTEAMGVTGFSAFDPSFKSTDIPQTPQILQTPDSTSGDSLFPATYLGTQRHADDLDNDPAVSSVGGFGQADDAIFGVNALEPDGAGISPSHFALMQPDFRTIGFDWLDFDMPESNPGLQEIPIIDTIAVEGCLIQILSDSKLPASAHVQDANTAQALSDLQRLLDLYFARFHDIQPILHRPTWNMAECPTVLLTAMACVGALLSDEERDTELSWSLSDICMPMITWLGASDGTYYRNISGMGLLSSRWSVGEDDGHEVSLATGPKHANQEWSAWVSREKEQRPK
ncbi:hypothetical protein HYQ44_019185 [Verticillium longisporum]|nr:hypothetical protein HYQ44_019185 [Verticillium longisporum]